MKTEATGTWRTKHLNSLGVVRCLWGLEKCGLNGNQQHLVCRPNPISFLVTKRPVSFWTVTLGMIFGALITRFRYVRNKLESRRVGELVQIALDTLRNQEFAHHTDPVTAPQPFLSSLQLRDLILQEEHSVSIRRRLWDRVERVVEGNANVRVNIEEVEGGDELRVWRWVGSSRSRRFESNVSSPYASPKILTDWS